VADFFFPYPEFDKNGVGIIRREAVSALNSCGMVTRQFSTFRTFAVHYFWTFFVNPIRYAIALDTLYRQTIPNFSRIGAIARDGIASSHTLNPTGSVTLAHSCAGNNLVLWVSVFVNSTASDIVTGITYNGVAMTRVPTDGFVGANAIGLYLYYLIGPATGNNNIVVSFSGTHTIDIFSSSYTGGNQTSAPDSSNHGSVGNPSTSPLTVATMVAASNCWLVGAACDDSIGLTAGTGTSLLGTIGGSLGFIDSNGTVGTGSRSMQMIWSGTVHDMNMIVCSMAPGFTISYKTLSVTAAASLALAKAVIHVKTLAVTAVSSVSMTFGKVYVKVLAVAASGAVSISKILIRVRSLAVTATGSVNINRLLSLYRTFSVTATGVVSLAKGQIFQKVLAVTGTAVVSVTRIITRVITLSVTAVAKVKMLIPSVPIIVRHLLPFNLM
jgi:hypothetical protein